jgi:sulfur transfer complex TusBCD TusB component (DsrH family)
MLHLLAFPATRRDLLVLMLQCLAEGDEVVLLDEGLQWLADGQALRQVHAKGTRMHALGETSEHLWVAGIDYQELIAISARHPASSSWYP